jgi:hypothetical protein
VTIVTLLVWAGHESRRAAALEQELAQVTVALDAAREEVAAHRRHLEAIRAGVGELEGQVAALKSLASHDPEPAAAPAGRPAGE